MAAATAEVVDGGGVCRDKYLLVNTERLARYHPRARALSLVRAANDMHSRREERLTGGEGENGEPNES